LLHTFDAIIIGAGPSGAVLSRELARNGINVALLEKEKLPRYKCCAGGLTIRAAKLLGQDISGAVEKVIMGAAFTLDNGKSYRRFDTAPIGYTVMRDRFDDFLVNQAEKDGVTVLQEHEVKGIKMDDEEVRVNTSRGEFHSKIIAGADGSSSTVARALGFKKMTDFIAAIEAEIAVSEETMRRWEAQITIEFGRLPGYAWVFPKSKHLSIGIGCHFSRAKGLKKHYREFVDSLDLGPHDVIRWRGSLIPICKRKITAVRGRALLLGDAAGLADPLTGEGIYNAILSAQIAAPVIIKSIRDGSGNLKDYQAALEKEILPDLKIANFISRVFLRFPTIIFDGLNRDDRIWNTGCALLRGEKTYRAIQDRLASLGGIYNFLTKK
jgi:geranylgeranyl reductase family protein